LQSTNWLLRPTREIVIVGRPGDSATDQMLSAIRSRKMVQTVVLFKPEQAPGLISGLAPFVKDMTMIDGQAAAYVCQGFSCRAPITSAVELSTILDSIP
ncbi:MAG: hypothetical protein P8X54_11020, partial [Desulfuromonadales bacterium]